MSDSNEEAVSHLLCPCGHTIEVRPRDLGLFCPECKRFGWCSVNDPASHPSCITWRQGHRKDDG